MANLEKEEFKLSEPLTRGSTGRAVEAVQGD